MIRMTRWAVGMVVFSASVSAFAQEEGPAEEPAPQASASTSVVADANAGESSAADEKKFKLGLRLGYALPLGDAAEGVKLSDGLSGQIPIWLDVGYMVTPNVLVGLYGQYGFAQVKNCDDGADCSAHDIRFGVQGQYHFSPSQSADPWLGLGFGYEVLGTSESGGGQSVDITYKGLEFLNLQGGADFKVADAFTLGPFLSFSLGQYSTYSLSGTLGNQSGDIDKTAMHEWLTFGAKGTFGL